jgi:biotin-(acetyl-CoA carboxylase) ligase
MPADAPQLPPLLRGIQASRPRVAALRLANDPAFEPGAVFWSPDPDRLAMAILFAPEVAAERAQEMAPLAMVAVGDAIGALAEPQMAFTFCWPGILLANGADVGDVAVQLPPDATLGAIPDWLVVAVELALRPAVARDDPGSDAGRTTLWDEGAGDLACVDVIGAIARHLLSWLNRWEDEGFAPVHESWMERADGIGEPMAALIDGEMVTGDFIGLDEHGGALLRTEAGTRLASILRNRAG